MQSSRNPSAFSLTATDLTLTSDLLRQFNPSLARALKTATLAITPPDAELAKEPQSSALLLRHLHVHRVSQILAALTFIGQSALDPNQRDLTPTLSSRELTLLGALLDHWIELADWALRHSQERLGSESGLG